MEILNTMSLSSTYQFLRTGFYNLGKNEHRITQSFVAHRTVAQSSSSRQVVKRP